MLARSRSSPDPTPHLGLGSDSRNATSLTASGEGSDPEQSTEFGVKTGTTIVQKPGVRCTKCYAFVVLDDVTNGTPPIGGGTSSPVAAYALTPPMKCGQCAYETTYQASDLRTRSF